MRWWHAQARDMIRLLQNARVPAEVCNMTHDIVGTCKARRQCQRPAPKNMPILRLSLTFNECVQVDLLFVGELIIVHLIDDCLRFSCGGITVSKEPARVLKVSNWYWVSSLHGPPQHLIADQEGALESDEARIYCDQHQI